MTHSSKTVFVALAFGPVFCLGSSANAVAVAFYTDSTDVGGFGPMAVTNANNWGGANFTNSSVIFETTIDYTSAVASATGPFALFENGADAFGSGMAIDGSTIYFASGGSGVASTAVASGPHGLTPGQTNIQILGVLEMDGGGNGTDELLSIYVNGLQVATAEGPTAGDWAGANTANLGTSDNFNIFEYVPALNPNAGDGANGQFAGPYPDQSTTIDFAAYELGAGDNTVANILVPEPGSLALLGLGGLALAGRRSRQ